MMYLTLFGATTVLSEDQPVAVTEFGGGKPREILEILAVAGGAPVAKDRLAELLWDGTPPKSWVATLESYISVLRRRLGCAPGRQSQLATTTNGYRLDMTRVQVDVVRFRTLAAEAGRLPVRECLALVDEALALASRDLLASEPTADWAQREKDAFRSDLVRLAGHGAAAALEVGDVEAAGRYATIMTQHDAIDEVGWQQLMVARWRAGRRSDALRAYAELRTVLADELGVEPSTQSRELYMQILRDEPTSGEVAGEQRLEIKMLTDLLRQCLETMGSTADNQVADAWSRAQRGLHDFEVALTPVPVRATAA
jgi:DNA-binding SARP family transcriptional activator